MKTNYEEMATNVDEGFTLEDHESEKNIIENKCTLIKLFIILTLIIILKTYFYPICWRQTSKAWSAPYTLEEDVNRDTEKTSFVNMALDDTNAEMRDEAAHNMNNWMKHNNHNADDTDAQHEELQRMQKATLANDDTEKTNFEKMKADDTNSHTMHETNFEKTNFEKTKFEMTNFEQTNFEKTNFEKTNLEKTNFVNTELDAKKYSVETNSNLNSNLNTNSNPNTNSRATSWCHTQTYIQTCPP